MSFYGYHWSELADHWEITGDKSQRLQGVKDYMNNQEAAASLREFLTVLHKEAKYGIPPDPAAPLWGSLKEIECDKTLLKMSKELVEYMVN